MKKINKESMQNFMLMHAEKLILGGCLAATGFFVYMSMSGENEVDTPTDLLRKATQAETYVNNPVWDKLEPFREGEEAAKDKIANANSVDPDKYSLSFMGTPTQALAPRQDPEILRPEQAIATRLTVGVMIESDFRSRLSEFFTAPTRLGDTGAGIGDFGGGDDDYGTDDGGYGGGGGTAGRSGLPEDYPTLDRSGTFNAVNGYTAKGLRPAALGISADRVTTTVFDVVCVTAVVDYQKQLAAFEKAFSNSVAYNTKRDRPVYQFLQVQRREITDPETPWEKAKDISEDVIYKYPKRCPSSLPKMPLQVYRSAPEVIAPANFDPILSGPIPAFVSLDYQQIASHPALKQQREFPAWVPPKNREIQGGDPEQDLFGQGDEPDDEYGGGGPGDPDGANALRRGSATEQYREALAMRKPGGQYRLVRFFDLLAPKNKSFEYRTRVWVGDPNQLDSTDGFNKNRGKRLEFDVESGVKFSAGSGVGSDVDGGMDDLDDMDADSSIDGNSRQEIVQDVKMSMLTPPVRKRQAAASDLLEMQEQLEKMVKSEEPMKSFHVSEYSKTGELEQVKLPPSPNRYAYIQYLRFARPSAWSDPVRVQRERRSADVYAGPTLKGRPVKMNSGGKTVQFESVEPAIEMVVSSWDRKLGAKLPSKKRAYIGETFNFKSPAFVTHPITWDVLVAQNPNANTDDLEKFMMPFRTGATIVDAFFGQQMDFPVDKRQQIETPTEVLTVDANGKLSVSSQFDAETDYRNEVTEKDSSRLYGRQRRQPKPVEDEYGDDYE